MCHGALLAAAVAAIKPSRFTLPKARSGKLSYRVETLRCLTLRAFALQAAAKMQRVRSLASAREKKNHPKAARASAKFDFAAVSWSPGTAPMAHSPDPGRVSRSIAG